MLTPVIPSPSLSCAQAWMRARGPQGAKTFTGDDVVEQFGVVKGSYDAVPLPKIKAYTVRTPLLQFSTFLSS